MAVAEQTPHCLLDYDSTAIILGRMYVAVARGSISFTKGLGRLKVCLTELRDRYNGLFMIEYEVDVDVVIEKVFDVAVMAGAANRLFQGENAVHGFVELFLIILELFP